MLGRGSAVLCLRDQTVFVYLLYVFLALQFTSHVRSPHISILTSPTNDSYKSHFNFNQSRIS